MLRPFPLGGMAFPSFFVQRCLTGQPLRLSPLQARRNLPFLPLMTIVDHWSVSLRSSSTNFADVAEPGRDDDISCFGTSVLTETLEKKSLLDLDCDNFAMATEGENLPFSVVSPGSMEIVGRVPSMGQKETLEAIERSADSLSSWRSTTGSYRSNLISSWSTLVKENASDISKIMTLECGKPIRESLGEVLYGASYLDFYAAEAIRPSSSGGGQLIPTPFADSVDGKTARGKVIVMKEAIGVTAMITPWNFPFGMIARKVGPALAAGCTAIVKPSELTPLTAIAIRKLALQAGIPKDVFQLITANKSATSCVGEELCRNPVVKKMSFTGSTAVGKLLMKNCSDSVKRVSLELGGNAAFIVFDDADVEVAVAAAMSSKYRNAGQTCVCADRFIIHKSIEISFLERMKKEVERLVVGDGMLEETTMGPMITPEAVSNVAEKVQEAIIEGAELILGGRKLENIGPNFYAPTIIRNVRESSRIWSEETFGPVACVRTFEDEDEAIAMANDTTSGLAVYFCSKNIQRIFRVSERLENGIVGINDGIISSAHCPFGGIKESGLGREGSSEGMTEYVETKYIFMNI